LASTEPRRTEFRIVRRDGTVRRIVSIGTLLRDAAGRPEAIHGVSIDDSDRIEREERLVRLKEEAESAARTKSAFLANMSHELRTPLNGVLGMLELLIAGSLDPTFERYARTAHASGASLLHLLDDILDLSKVEAGKLELVTAPFDPRALLVEACELFRRRAEDRGLALRLEGVATLPASVVGDEWRIRQVLLNLLGNAIKFTEFGEVVVTAAADATPDGTRLRFEVCDTGIGIPATVQARLFEPFAQGDSSTTRRFGGSGLGLSITRELVALMEGTLDFTSVEGQGTTFRVTLPLRLGSAAGVARPLVATTDADALVPPLRAALAGRRLLVVEDHAVNRTVVLEMLRPLDVPVDVAVDGAEGVAAIERTRYDLVLLDHQMPVMDGLTAAATIRRRAASLPGGTSPVLVAMTASAMRGDRERCLEAGMHDYLAKPLSRHALFEMLTRHFVAGAAAPDRGAAMAPSDTGATVAAGVPSAAHARIGGTLHALSNAVQAEDAEATRRHAAALVAIGRDVGDRALVDAARGLAVSVPPVGADWAALQGMTRALAAVASAAADQAAAADGPV
ncbi:MAG: ATP-binding protein, partial [Gemmatimonadaceae bacterium]|nr:ATP-binding protein [Gemmatimonadaceae bacterium]